MGSLDGLRAKEGIMPRCLRVAWIGCHLVALMVLCPPLFGAAYYIDKGFAQASDLNLGSESQPWATIRKAISVMGPGDTVYVKNGVYNEINDFMRSGTPGLPITIRNYPGHHPIVDGTGRIDATFDWSGAPGDKADWITIDGFEIRNYWNYGVAISGDHNSILNCNIHTNLGVGRGEPIIIVQGDYNRIIGNEVHDSDWNGINVQNANFTEIAYNKVYDTPYHGAINIISNTEVYYGMMEGNDIHHNILFNNPGAIYIRYQFNNKIYNNLIFQTDPGAIVIDISFQSGYASFPTHYVANTEIYNNTIVRGRWMVASDSADNVIIKNNIFKDPDGGVFINMFASTSGHVLDSNLYSGTGQFKIAGHIYNTFAAYHAAGYEPHSLSGDPGFRNGALNDYLLLPGSISVNAGVDLSGRGVTNDLRDLPRPQDGLFDFGAFEYTDQDVQVQPQAPSGLRIRP